VSDAPELVGPDLAAGIPVSDLAEGRPLAGHAGGEAVLLVRRGEAVFAVGATCSHYGGPLAEGLVVGDTIRCPWHHAVFELGSGRALRPPALNPIGCWTVVREGDRVRVAEKRPVATAAPHPDGASHPAGAPPALAGAPESVVIVGAGAAGLAAALAVRDAGYAGPVALVGAEDTPPIDRPNLSKDYLAGSAPEEWMPLRPPGFYAERGIDLATGVAAVELDVRARRVTLADGRVLPFGALLLATGATPVRLPLPGGSLPHVHTLRTLADSRAIVAGAGAAQHAVVMGAGFIGLEVAASLVARGLQVHVVAPDARPLERALGPQVGDFLRSLHESRGVVFHLGQRAAAIEAGAVILGGGQALPAELVVIGAGVRPDTLLADRAGLATDRGIVVDAFLETSAPGVYAAGDVARYPDPHSGQRVRIEHWVVAERQGRAAGRNLLGLSEPFEDVPFFWSQHYDVTLACVGHAERWDDIEVDGSLEARDCTLTYRAGGRTLAVVTLFRDGASLAAEAAMERALAERV
jgi:NADPH-dependent 2,4-dienoyl-CoA reductase/sulfur reductase-like enzyme/nitrite reductase/ring-hydroxylating ferredoxin subunit